MLNSSKRILGTVVLALAFLSLFGHVVKEYAKPNAENGFLSALYQFVSFPKMAMEVFESKEIRNIPPTFEATLATDTFNHLNKDVYGLMSLYNRHEDRWDILLLNFRDDAIHFRWKLTKDNFHLTDRQWANAEPRNPILLPNRNLITNNDETRNLYRLDAQSNIVWHNTEKQFHHAMNVDADGNIWVCTTELRRIKIPQQNEPVPYEDDYITKVDVESGKILQHKSTSDIFIQNGYRNYVYGFANGTHNRLEQDPLHLNDIEPALENGRFWKKGDLFLSFRNRSLVVQYRPSSNKIIRLIHGMFLKQHDVDILNDSTLSIFNNEGTNVGSTHIPKWEWEHLEPRDTIEHSNVVHYHFTDSSFSFHFKKQFKEHEIFSEYQGFHHTLSDGTTYVEEHTDGLLYFMNEEQVLYKKQLPNRLDTLVENPHWVRLYENIDF